MRVAAALLLLSVAPYAAAWDLQIDPSGGPLVLIDQVEAALADWTAAGADVEGVDRTVVVRYGDAERLGPDAIVLVVVRPESGSFDVLVRPDGEGVRAALVPALGVVLGGVPGSGALDPRVDGSAPRVPTATDVLALRAGRPEVPGDLDGDGRVGFEDLLLMAAAYGRQGINLPEDLDGDGVVGDGDLELLRALYEFADRAAPAGPSDGADPVTGPVADPTADAIDAPEAGPNDAPAEDAPPDREGDDDGEAPPDEDDGED